MAKALTKVSSQIWRWDGVDADHGFPIVGYITNLTGDLVMIDPPGTSGSKEEVRAIGDPQGILLTNMWHVRGAIGWSKTFGIHIHAPKTAVAELEEAGGDLDVEVKEGDIKFGWQSLQLSVQHDGKTAFDEIAYWHEPTRTLVIGDLIVEKEDGQFGFGPNLFAGVPIDLLTPLYDRLVSLSPQVVLSAHLGVKDGMPGI